MSNETTSDTKPCPVCGETIKIVAKKCIHCNEFLEKYERPGWERRFGWTGLKGKTVWDFVSLLIIPFALAVFGFVLSSIQGQRQHAIEDKRIAAQRSIEVSRASSNALQEYLDDMSIILLQHDITKGSVIGTARARTISILRELDATRNGIVINFLQQTNLIKNILFSVRL
jgi:hypothetical protein